MSVSEILPVIHRLQHADKLRLMRILLADIAKEDGVDLEPPAPAAAIPKFTWEGGLAELKSTYSSVELQKKALEWR